MGNVIMKAQQITYGASNVEAALDALKVPELIELDKRMAAIDEWKANVHEVTFTGSELTIENALALPARSLITSINAIQDLHGQPFPYVEGAYKNKLPMTVSAIKAANTLGTWSDNAYTLNGVTFTILTDSADNVTGIKANGTASAATYFTIYSSSNTGEYFQNKILSGCPTGGSGEKYSLLASDTVSVVLRDYGSGVTITNDTGVLRFQIQISSGYAANNVAFYPMVRLSTESDASFAPYSNICPISGRTEVVLTRSDGDEISEDFTIQLGTTVYGADINWDTGVATVDRVLADNSLLTVFRNNTAGTGTLASFNKTTNGYASQNAYTTSIFKPQTVSQWEALDADTILTDSATGYCVICTDVPNQTQEQLQQWLTDKGAQICLYLATPTTLQLTPTQLEMLKGYNRVTIDNGSIELKALVLGGDN